MRHINANRSIGMKWKMKHIIYPVINFYSYIIFLGGVVFLGNLFDCSFLAALVPKTV